MGRRFSYIKGAGGKAFAPSDITGLNLWLYADAITGLSDDDAVGTWADQSGNGNDATQGTAGQKPLYKTNIQNSLPVVRFDGTDDVMVVSDGASLQSAKITLFVACKPDATAVYDTIITKASGAWAAGWGVFYDTAPTPDVQRGWVNLYTGTLVYFTGWLNNTWACATLLFDQTDLESFKNGTSIMTDNDVNAINSVGEDILIGAYTTAGVGSLAMDVGEIILYNTNLSAVDRSSVETYLINKWGL